MNVSNARINCHIARKSNGISIAAKDSIKVDIESSDGKYIYFQSREAIQSFIKKQSTIERFSKDILWKTDSETNHELNNSFYKNIYSTINRPFLLYGTFIGHKVSIVKKDGCNSNNQNLKTVPLETPNGIQCESH